MSPLHLPQDSAIDKNNLSELDPLWDPLSKENLDSGSPHISFFRMAESIKHFMYIQNMKALCHKTKKFCPEQGCIRSRRRRIRGKTICLPSVNGRHNEIIITNISCRHMSKYIVNELPLDRVLHLSHKMKLRVIFFPPSVILIKKHSSKDNVFFSYWKFYELEVDYVASEFYNSTLTWPWRR